MGLGWLAAAELALKLFQGFSKGKAAQNQGKAQKAANEAKYKAEGDLWRANEAHRATGADAASALLGNVQGSLQPGAPNYQIDPAILAKMKEARPYPGSLPADPTAGSTWALLGGMAGGGAEAIDQYQMGKLLQGSSAGSGGGGGQYVNKPVGGSGSTLEPVAFTDDRSRVCALNPRLAGCGGGGE